MIAARFETRRTVPCWLHSRWLKSRRLPRTLLLLVAIEKVSTRLIRPDDQSRVTSPPLAGRAGCADGWRRTRGSGDPDREGHHELQAAPSWPVMAGEASGGQLRALSRQAMRSYARYWLETFRLPVMPVDRLVGGMRDTGHIRTAFEYLAAGRGVVFALPHMGNWDQAGAWIIASGAGSLTAVIERVKPESVYDRFVAFREGLGMEVLPASGGTQRFGILAQRLRAGKMVGLICDRDVTGGGIEVEFFGEKARMMGGPAALALQTGAALMPAILWFEGDGWGVHVHEEIRVPAEGDTRQKAAAMTQDVARLFEAGIRAHPQDWHMLQKVFTADLDPARLAAAEGTAGAGHGEGGS